MKRLSIFFALLLAVTGCASSESAEKTDAPATSEASAEGTSESAEADAEAGAEGLGIRGEATPVEGVTVSGQPDEAALKKAAELGYKTVINLRAADEEGFLANEGEIVSGLGMTYVHLPPAEGADFLSDDAAKKLGEALAAEGALPALVHCRGGNKAAALLGLKSYVVDHMARDAAVGVVEKSGNTKLQNALEAKLVEKDAAAAGATE
jgi:uncharacterized protein (TIGR01244 family)